MATSQTKWAILEIAFVGLCFFSNNVDAHILVFRRANNQLIEEYNDLPAQFGPSLPPNGFKVFAIPVKPDKYACETIDPPPRLIYPNNAKFVAIIERGGIECTFELKVRHAQAAHFNAVIVYNNEGDDLEQMSAQNSSGINIPAVFVGHTTGINLMSFYTEEVVLVINDELPFNINTQLILPFSILIGLCFLIMIFYMIYKCIREERRLRRHRLPKRMLNKLPILKYTKNSDLSYETCVICLDEFVEGDKLRVLPCRHPYHSHCIDPWLTENRRVCPICKRKVFTKGEARSTRNRQSSLDSVTDTDDDTTPLLNQQVPTVNADASPTTTYHGTFSRVGAARGTSTSSVDVAMSDDENALLAHQSPMHNNSRRVNPFNRSPDVQPHVQVADNRRSFWSRPIFRLFRRSQPISVAAPAFLDEMVPEVIHTATPSIAAAPAHTSNNILNPNLSGSFKDSNDDDDDDEPLPQSIYEPITVITQNDHDSIFIQTPTQGGIGVVALPNTNVSGSNAAAAAGVGGVSQSNGFFF